MSLCYKICLPNGREWWVGSEMIWDSDSDAQVIIPVEQLEGMSDEEIGRSVRALVRKAHRCNAEEYAGRVISHPDAVLSRPEDLKRYRDAMLPFANESEIIQKALALLDAGLPNRKPRPVIRGRYPQAGYIYLLASEHGYKIGKSKDAPSRTKALGTKLPFPANLIHTIQTSDMAWAEEHLHIMFAHCRLHGEWFDLTTDEVGRICMLDTIDPESEQA